MTDERTHNLPPEDLELLAQLRRAAEGATPERAYLRELGRAAFSVRGVEAELARLVADSTRQRELVLSRRQSRLVTFAADEVSHRGAGVAAGAARPTSSGSSKGCPSHRRRGSTWSPAAGRLITAPVDDLGQLTVDDVPPQPCCGCGCSPPRST